MWDKTKVQDGVKRIYSDLGYVANTNAFNDNRTDYLTYGTWIAFSQREFMGGSVSSWNFDDSRMAETGHVYVPHSCYTKTCRLHVSLHGCGFYHSYLGNS